jgi:hypothetical protein
MLHSRDLLGWLALATTVATLGACDDPQQNCRDVAKRYDVCAPQIIEQALQGMPENFDAAIQSAKEAQQKKIKETVVELNAQCAGATFSEADKKQFRIWRTCVKKPCSELTKCIRGLP